MKISFYTVPLALSIGLLGCNQPEPTTTETVPKHRIEEEILQREFVSQLPDSAPTLRVATTGNMPPFSFQDEYGHLQGIDIDAIRAIGEVQGFKVDFYKEDWSDLFTSVAQGKRDLAVSGISYNEDRALKYGLSNPYFFNPSAIMYKDTDLKIRGLEDLQGLRVGVLDNSKQMQQVQEVSEAGSIIPRTTTFLLFADLVQGKVDAIVQDLPLLKYTATNHSSQSVTIATYEDKDDPLAHQVMLTAKDNTALIDELNDGIAKLKSTGEMSVIKGKWLSATTPATVNHDVTTPSNTTSAAN